MRAGHPFVGPAGALLDKALSDAMPSSISAGSRAARGASTRNRAPVNQGLPAVAWGRARAPGAAGGGLPGRHGHAVDGRGTDDDHRGPRPDAHHPSWAGGRHAASVVDSAAAGKSGTPDGVRGTGQRPAARVAAGRARLIGGLRLVVFGRLAVFGLVAPGIGLRSRHDAGNVRILTGTGASARTAALPRLGPARRLFLLFLCASALAFTFAPRQRIPSSHVSRILPLAGDRSRDSSQIAHL